MLSFLSDEQRRERPYAIIGIIGSFVALASFLLLPIGLAGTGGPLPPTNGWKTLQILLTPPFGPGSIIGSLDRAAAAWRLHHHAGHRGRGVVSAWMMLLGAPPVYAGPGVGPGSAGASRLARTLLLPSRCWAFGGWARATLAHPVGEDASRRSAHRCTPARCHFSRLQASPSRPGREGCLLSDSA